MHTRKQYLIYPPNYDHRVHRYKIRYSKWQTWKLAMNMGAGAEIYVLVNHHPARCQRSISDSSHLLWEIYRKTEQEESCAC